MSSSVTFTSKPQMANGEPVPAGAPSPVKAALAIVLNHTAEVFQAVVDAVADHYKLDKEEMMSVIVAHPAYTGVTLNPVLNDLGFLGSSAASTAQPKKTRAPLTEEQKAARKAKMMAKKAVAPIPPPVVEPSISPAPIPTPPPSPAPETPPKKKKFIFKKPGDTSSTVSSTS